LREGTTAEAESDAMHAANAVTHQHRIAQLKAQREADSAARLRNDRDRVRALQATLKAEHFSRLHAEAGLADEMLRVPSHAEEIGLAVAVGAREAGSPISPTSVVAAAEAGGSASGFQGRCCKCGVPDSDEHNAILLCDGCDMGFHMLCLTPCLLEVPEEDWFCPKCSSSSVLGRDSDVKPGVAGMGAGTAEGGDGDDGDDSDCSCDSEDLLMNVGLGKVGSKRPSTAANKTRSRPKRAKVKAPTPPLPKGPVKAKLKTKQKTGQVPHHTAYSNVPSTGGVSC
jgi:hypothetical protein